MAKFDELMQAAQRIKDGQSDVMDSTFMADIFALKAQRDELLALLAESQTSIGGDWRERRDALIAKHKGAEHG